MTEKVHLEDLIPLTTESSDEMRGGVEPGKTASKRSRVVYPSLGGFLVFPVSKTRN